MSRHECTNQLRSLLGKKGVVEALDTAKRCEIISGESGRILLCQFFNVELLNNNPWSDSTIY